MLEVHDLSKSFGALRVTQGVSLSLAAGERRAVIGPNGAGKTTFFNLLSGELKPDAGRILLRGTDITALPPNRRGRLGLGRSFQKNNLLTGLTVRENLALAAQVAGRRTHVFWRNGNATGAISDTVDEVAGQVGLADQLEEPVDQLPYGAKRQLEVGLALATRPQVLLLDEPTSGVSPEETDTILQLILGLPRSLAVVVIEHDMDVVYSLADKVSVLDAGRIVFEGTPRQARDSELVREIYLGEFGHA